MKQEKTNVMRILEDNNIAYEAFYYETNDEGLSKLREEIDNKLIFKTIVCISHDKKYFVFVLNINDEIDLKKAARLAQTKSLELINLNDLPKVTGGYIRGGTSPIGMKKLYPTFMDLKVIELEKIYISAGKRGVQVLLNPFDLEKLVYAKIDDITK